MNEQKKEVNVFARFLERTKNFASFSTKVKEAKAEIKEADKKQLGNKVGKTKKEKVMVDNEKNYEYLKDQLKYTGFPEELEPQLRANLEQQKDSFNIDYRTEIKGDKVDASLYFSKSQKSDIYFFNSFNLKIESEDAIVQSQRFYMGQSGNPTLREGYNLMHGRSVEKLAFKKDPMMVDGVIQKSENGKEMHEQQLLWRKLDLKKPTDHGYSLGTFSPAYGYSLEETLSKLPIKELENDLYKANVIDSLKKGNRQMVTFVKDGVEQKRFIEANVQFKKIDVYDTERGRGQKPVLATTAKQDQAKPQKVTNKTAQSKGQSTATAQAKKSRGRKAA